MIEDRGPAWPASTLFFAHGTHHPGDVLGSWLAGMMPVRGVAAIGPVMVQPCQLPAG
jgi:hypothetical protein